MVTYIVCINVYFMHRCKLQPIICAHQFPGACAVTLYDRIILKHIQCRKFESTWFFPILDCRGSVIGCCDKNWKKRKAIRCTVITREECIVYWCSCRWSCTFNFFLNISFNFSNMVPGFGRPCTSMSFFCNYSKKCLRKN